MSDQSEKKISDVEVLFPESHGNKLNQYKRYKIKFCYKGTEMEIFRRYSDFEELRKNLRKYLPFHYILPLHHKAVISNTDETALQFRVDELQKFLNFILEGEEFLDCDSFWKFFDSNLKDTKVGQILNQMGQVTWEYTEFILRKRYSEKFKIEYSDEMEEKIIKFKERIDISVSFCKSFYQSIKAHVNNLKETPLFSSQSTFFNLLAIHYSNQNDNSTFEEIEQSCKSVNEQDVKGSWKKLEKRAKMISVEMNCLLEIYKDFSNLVSQKNHELNKSKKLNQSIKDLENSDVRTVGFFKKKSKGDKLNDLHHDLQLCDEKIKLLQKLIAVSSDIIMNEQLLIIKKRKQKRFKNAMDEFAEEQSQFLQPKNALWDVLKKANEKMFGQDVQEIDLGGEKPQDKTEEKPKEQTDQLFILIQLLKIQSISLTNYLDFIGQPLMYLQLFLTKSAQIQQTFNNLSSTNLALGCQVNQKNAFQIQEQKLFKVYVQ